jgi:hypothetical protein
MELYGQFTRVGHLGPALVGHFGVLDVPAFGHECPEIMAWEVLHFVVVF